MSALILRDSAKIQTQDALRHNRRLEREGKLVREPLYEIDEAEPIIAQISAVPYNKPVPVADGIQATWAEAGHMLGSESIKLTGEDEGRQKNSGQHSEKNQSKENQDNVMKHRMVSFVERHLSTPT